jgi:hypothetical protein
MPKTVVFKYIYNYMLEHKLLYKFQSGFVSGHSTSHQLIELYHNQLSDMILKLHSSRNDIIQN